VGLATVCVLNVSAETQPAQMLVKAIQGQAAFSTDHKTWQPLTANTVLQQGAEIRTEANSSADLILQSSDTGLRMTAGPTMEVTKLSMLTAGEDVITQTRLNVKEGSILGSQRKLSKPSTFNIDTPECVATIVGTEYKVSASGPVSCFSGAVTCNTK